MGDFKRRDGGFGGGRREGGFRDGGSRSGGGFRDGGRRGGFDRGGSSRGGNSRGRGGDRGPVTMYDAVCDKCGKDCQVPFQPTDNGKELLCSDCFSKKNESMDRGSRRFEDRGFSRGGSQSTQNNAELVTKLDQINEKLDRVLRAIELKVITGDQVTFPFNKPEVKPEEEVVADL